MQLYIGQTQVRGAFPAYAKKLNLLELLAEPQRLPKLPRLEGWAQQAPEGFVFSVVLSPSVFDVGDGAAKALSYGLKVRQALRASFLVLRTPPSLRPSVSSEKKLASVIDSVRRDLPDVDLAWEPRGLWSGSGAEAVADSLGVIVLRDAKEAKPANTLYVRHRSIGVGTRTGGRMLETLALACVQSERALVVVDGGSALPLRQELSELFAEFSEPDDDLLDDEADQDEALEDDQDGEEEDDLDADEPDADEPDADEPEEAGDA